MLINMYTTRTFFPVSYNHLTLSSHSPFYLYLEMAYQEIRVGGGDERMRKQNPAGAAVVVVYYTKMEPENKVVKLSPNEELPSRVWPKPKHGSVIPAKRRSVKRMMFDQIVQFIAHVLCPRNKANSSSIKKTKTM